MHLPFKKALAASLAAFAMTTLLTPVAGAAPQRPAISAEDAYAIGVDAYTYAYPMVIMEMTRRYRTNAVAPDPKTRQQPLNQFAHATEYADATIRSVVRPNADTLYSSMFFDVGKEPIVLTLPDTGDRYHVIPFMDMFTDVFATLGTRSNGNGGGVYALVGPRWKGQLPAGVERIDSPTDVGYIIGRIQANGPSDYGFVHKLQAGLNAVPLSAWGQQGYKPPQGTIDPTVDMKTPPPFLVEKMEPAAFFALFAELLKRNPPHATDVGMVERLKRVGIVPGQSFDLNQASEPVRNALVRAAPDAMRRIRERAKTVGFIHDGWNNSREKLGVYGNDYLLRAFIAYAGLGALPNEEALYPMAAKDGDGQPLTGASRYVLHFEKAQLPPVKAFWSLTMYGADQFFVPNALNRYAIGDRDKLAYNADGSLDLYIQKDSPGADKESNWLPAPAGPFTMNLRLYYAANEALDGRWLAPPVKRLP
ncbi:MAG: DUF1254 domain-containing protein [Acidovorax sp.]